MDNIYKRLEETKAIIQHMRDLGQCWLDRASELEGEKRRLTDEVKRQERKVENLKNQLLDSQKSFQSQKEEISRLHREFEDSINTTTELRKRLALRDEEYRGLRKEFQDFRTQIEKRDQAIIVTESLFDLKEKKAEFEAQKAELEEQARLLKAKSARLEEKSKELESREQALNLSEAALENKKADYESQHADFIREKRDLRTEKERLQEEKDANTMLKREYERREKELQSLQDECEKLKGEIATLIRRKARLQAEGDSGKQTIKSEDGLGAAPEDETDKIRSYNARQEGELDPPATGYPGSKKRDATYKPDEEPKEELAPPSKGGKFWNQFGGNKKKEAEEPDKEPKTAKDVHMW